MLKIVCLFVCLFVIRESLSVSLVFVGWKIGLVFRLSDGTQVWCPVVDLVPRCCSSAENERGRGGGGTKRKKKLWVQGLFVARARCEGQGNMLLCTSTVATVSARKKTHHNGTMVRGKVPQIRNRYSHFPAPYIFVPPFATRIAGRPFFFPKPPPRKVTPCETLRGRERPTPTSWGNEGGDEASGRGWERYCLD